MIAIIFTHFDLIHDYFDNLKLVSEDSATGFVWVSTIRNTEMNGGKRKKEI